MQESEAIVFLAIEGIDGSGKSTQARMLVQWLRKQGRKAIRTREPTQSEIGELLRGILRKHTDIDPKALTFLFIADRIEHANQIKAALDDGKIVVCDRYMLSTLAYQSAQGLDMKWLKGLHEGILEPDLTFILDLDPEASMQRLRSDEKFERIEFQKKVRDKYLELSKEYPNTHVIQTGGTRMRTHQEMLDILQEKLEPLKD